MNRKPISPTVLIPEKIATTGIDLLDPHCNLVAPWRDGRTPTAAEVRMCLYDADAVIIRLLPVTGDDLAHCRNLKVIGRHGVGIDNVDCRAATQRGIPVVYTPAATTQSVAEHTIAMIMALAKQIAPASRLVASGRFGERIAHEGIELADKTLGVIGLGRIGRRVATMAVHGLSMNALAYDPALDKFSYDGPARIEPSLEMVLGQSDFLSLHVPLSAQTRRMINERTINACKNQCRIINTSRGAVIDEHALVNALHSKRLAGAALDVYETEPLPAEHPLC
ncbi:MAG: NAD(P)-dependent oxidoreductase, partial [Pirellulaceae bacterium]|nr:NAD(P)-dependent oxidoreductase [Pirellulaceae bacterium]